MACQSWINGALLRNGSIRTFSHLPIPTSSTLLFKVLNVYVYIKLQAVLIVVFNYFSEVTTLYNLVTTLLLHCTTLSQGCGQVTKLLKHGHHLVHCIFHFKYLLRIIRTYIYFSVSCCLIVLHMQM